MLQHQHLVRLCETASTYPGPYSAEEKTRQSRATEHVGRKSALQLQSFHCQLHASTAESLPKQETQLEAVSQDSKTKQHHELHHRLNKITNKLHVMTFTIADS
jgi:hypothetical protein